MTFREIIIESFHEVLEQRDGELRVAELDDDVVLLESGLDSLGFAILVATLDEKLDVDPFVEMKDPIYPKDFGEFVKVYEAFE